MRVFLCEFVTGGGLQGNPLPASLVREGLMMRDALARDLAESTGVELTATHDARVAPTSRGESRPIADGDDPWRVWAELAQTADVAWAIAPETGGVLLRLTALCRDAGATVIGPDDAAIRTASSKRLTAGRLGAAGVATPPAWAPDAIPVGEAGPFVSKPDDGAGCEATLFWPDRPPPGAVPRDHVVQPFVTGEPASLTVLRAAGATTVLTANRQHVTVEDGVFAFRGLAVGALDAADPRLAALARAVAGALPGLDGFFGIDFVRSGDRDVVIEVNPRLTTAYAGLRQALGFNPLRLLPIFAGAERPAPPARVPVQPVELRI